MHRSKPTATRRARRAGVVFTALIGVLVSSMAFVTPTSATQRSSLQRSAVQESTGYDRGTTVAFDIVGYRCELDVTSTRTRSNGNLVVRSTQTGRTDASIALMTGTLTVRTTALIKPDGTGKLTGIWTMEPDASTGTIRGNLSGSIFGPDAVEIRSRGFGRQALRGVTVQMVTTSPAPNDDSSCDPAPETPLAFAGSGEASQRAQDAPAGAVVVESNKDFATAVADLTAAIEGNPNLGLVKTVDHQAAAASRDLDLAPTTELFFGNPNLGTPLMQSSQRTGIDLPQKMLIWEDLLGVVRVAYNAPAYLESRHDLAGVDGQLQTIANALAGLAGVASGTTVEPVFDAGRVDKNRGLVSQTSTKTVDEAFAAIVAALEAAPPVNVAFTLEHDANAARVGLELRPTKVVVFGNPSLGTTLMQTDQTAALDLPQKILVYENDKGETVILYNEPKFVARRHGLRGQSDVLDILAGALGNFSGVGL